jgi:succinylglutamate desuccinylase
VVCIQHHNTHIDLHSIIRNRFHQLFLTCPAAENYRPRQLHAEIFLQSAS